jgi:3-isopropylmalate/(R)-2-methylmalate dehydratase small subunit
MLPNIRGKAYVLGDNIDTDQIIPAQYLMYNPAIPEEYKMFGKFALCGVPGPASGLPLGNIPFHDQDEFLSPYSIIIGGRNYGCGSSREHAPIALAAAGVKAVVAESFARIFFRNAVNGGYLIPIETVQRICEDIRTGDEVEIDFAACLLTNHTTKDSWKLHPLGEVAPIVEAGGVFGYAKRTGMVKV